MVCHAPTTTLDFAKLHLHSNVVLASANDTTAIDFSKDAFVSSQSVVSFVGKVDQQTKEDLLNSTLLAQLAATHKVGGQANVEKNIEGWYTEYRRVLSGIGWVSQAFDFSEFNASSASFTMDAVVLEVLKAMLTSNELAVMKATLDAMQKLSSDNKSLKLFDSNASNVDKGNFQIGIASVDNGVPVFKIACIHFSQDKKVTRVLWFQMDKSKTHLYKAGQSMSLNLTTYGAVRQKIIDKLGASACSFIDALDITI